MQTQLEIRTCDKSMESSERSIDAAAYKRVMCCARHFRFGVSFTATAVDSSASDTTVTTATKFTFRVFYLVDFIYCCWQEDTLCNT